jgi:hypothetical protein
MVGGHNGSTSGEMAGATPKIMSTALYFYGSILLRALKSKIIVLLTYVYKK